MLMQMSLKEIEAHNLLNHNWVVIQDPRLIWWLDERVSMQEAQLVLKEKTEED